MYTTDFAYDGPIFLVPLSLSYPSSPVFVSLRIYCIANIWKGPIPNTHLYSIVDFLYTDEGTFWRVLAFVNKDFDFTIVQHVNKLWEVLPDFMYKSKEEESTNTGWLGQNLQKILKTCIVEQSKI